MNATTDELVTIYVEDLAYQVKTGGNLLEACLGLAKDLPYFCWHPSMGSVGACRQCAVMQYRDADDKVGTEYMGKMALVKVHSAGTLIWYGQSLVLSARESITSSVR